MSAPTIPAARRTSVAGSAAGVMASTVVTLAIGYLASILLARSLGPAGRGLIAVMQADVALIVSLAGLGTPAAITYFASRRLRYQPALSGFALIYGCVLGVLSFATVLLAGGWIADHQGHGFDDRLWWLVAALIPLMYIEFFATSLLNARRAFALSNRLNILGRVGTLVATASLVTGLELGHRRRPDRSVADLARQDRGHRADGRADRPAPPVAATSSRATLSYGWRVAIGQMFRFFSGRFDVLVLSWLAPLATVGNYAIAQTVAELVLIIPQSFGFVVMPMVAAGEDHRAAPALRLAGTLGAARCARRGARRPRH